MGFKHGIISNFLDIETTIEFLDHLDEHMEQILVSANFLILDTDPIVIKQSSAFLSHS
jgi:hypothetical protein